MRFATLPVRAQVLDRRPMGPDVERRGRTSDDPRRRNEGRMIRTFEALARVQTPLDSQGSTGMPHQGRLPEGGRVSRSFTIVSSVLLLWIAPQTFAQWTCDTQGCANPAIVSTTAKTVAVGLDASVPPAPGPPAPSQIRTGVDANFHLWSVAGLGVPGVMINSVHDGGGGGILTNLMYNAASHIFWTGKVGVNTTSPSARLHISDGNATGNGNLFVQSTGGDGVIRLQGGGTNQGFIRYNDAGQYLSFSNSRSEEH